MSATIQRFTLGAGEEVRSFVRLVGQIASAIQAGTRAAAEAERLLRLSDAQLAARGLRRDEIARGVFEIYFAD